MGFADVQQPDDTGNRFEETYRYKYYLLADEIPIRLLLNLSGHVVMSEILDNESREFEQSQHVTKIWWDDAGEYEETTKEIFYKKCDEYLAYWTPEKLKEAKEGLEQFQKLIDEGFFDD